MPRIALAVAVEVVAFFFLRLYKYSISDIKYYQNELTNIELKALAVVIQSGHKNAEMKDVAASLISTERNFIIKKDERTIDILHEEVRATAEDSLVDKITEAIKAAVRKEK